MTTQVEQDFGTRAWATLVQIYDVLVGFIAELTRAERALLIATLAFAGVGANSSYLFYEPVRGPIVGGLAAVGVELLYVGGAGVAVKRAYQKWLAGGLIVVGFLASSYFGVMVSLRHALPMMFGIDSRGIETGVVVWPSFDQWAVFGGPAIVEGIVPALAALAGSVLLHSMVSQRLTDDDEQRAQTRKDARPFTCPFCTEPHGSPSALFGHYGRCAEAQASSLTIEEKKALMRKAVEEGRAALTKI